jgi:hypothetical protein
MRYYKIFWVGRSERGNKQYFILGPTKDSLSNVSTHIIN